MTSKIRQSSSVIKLDDEALIFNVEVQEKTCQDNGRLNVKELCQQVEIYHAQLLKIRDGMIVNHYTWIEKGGDAPMQKTILTREEVTGRLRHLDRLPMLKRGTLRIISPEANPSLWWHLTKDLREIVEEAVCQQENPSPE